MSFNIALKSIKKNSLISQIKQCVEKIGEKLMEIYCQPFDVSYKSDKSPVTGHPKINPLDSGPTTTSTPKSFACAAKSSIQALKPVKIGQNAGL